MRRFLLALLLCLIPLTSAQAARELPKPKIIALYFYADWCPVCKALSPKFAEARTTGDLDKKDVLFVTLNLTNKTTIHQSVMLAQSLGVGEFVQKQGSGTGYIALLDARTKKELARIEGDVTAESIKNTIISKLGD